LFFFLLLIEVEKTLREKLASELAGMPITDVLITEHITSSTERLIDATRELEQFPPTAHLAMATNSLGEVLERLDMFQINVIGACRIYEEYRPGKQLNICKATPSKKIGELYKSLVRAEKEVSRAVVSIQDMMMALSNIGWAQKALEDAVKAATRAFETCKAVTGRKCAFFEEEYRKPVSEVNASLAALFNDLAYAVHRIADHIATLTLLRLNESPPVYATEEYNRELARSALAWARATELMYYLGKIKHEDFHALDAVVTTAHAQFKASSTPGHLAYMYVVDGAWLAEYYDKNDVVREILARLWKERGLDVKTTDYGLKVFVPYGKEVDFALVLALATGMSTRIEALVRRHAPLEEILAQERRLLLMIEGGVKRSLEQR
jgi:hypothetical protein